MKMHATQMKWGTVFGVIILVLVLYPLVAQRYWMHVAITTFYYVLLAVSWDALAGYTGQFSFGHAVFASIGAYIHAMLMAYAGVPPMISVILGAIFSCVVSMAIGAVCVKMSGAYLALTTLAFSEIVRLILINEDQWTRGPRGLIVPPLFKGQNIYNYYYLMFIVTILVIIVLYRILYSPTGLIFKSLMDDELAASVLGVDVVKQRLYAFSLAGLIAGLAGALYSSYIVVITPSLGALSETFNAISMSVIGGMGTVVGALIGAPLLYVSAEILRQYGTLRYLIQGLLVILVVRFAPEGIVGLVKRAWESLKGRKR
ncbi:branched-chain amino acid ABC transporter permease [candidate division KSB1 bacterium]|nr:MAG: branched-chain amino acid ABC transporter permease [candidate division KSB1 bacterium]